MKYQSPLTPCTFLKRYKRFLTDVRLDNGEIMTVHCANSGSMKTCMGNEWQCYISKSPNQKRKLPYTLELLHNGTSFIGVNTALANKIVMEGLTNNRIPEITGYDRYIPEVRYAQNSRIDILGTNNNDEKCYIEIKSVSMVRDGKYAFPDAVTKRGLKHLKNLLQVKEEGHRAVIFFLLMRNDGATFEAASEIDPEYAACLDEVTAKGVEMIVYHTRITPDSIEIGERLCR